MQALRPFAGADALDAADDLDDALHHHQHADDRDQRLEMIDRRPERAGRRVLVHHPRQLGVAVAGIDERQHAGEEEQEIEHQVHLGLGARRPGAIEEVAAHVAVARQRIGAGQHEQRAVEHVAGVERPLGRRQEQVAHEHFVAGGEGENEDAPAGGLADPGADLVDDEAIIGSCSPRAAQPPRSRLLRRNETQAASLSTTARARHRPRGPRSCRRSAEEVLVGLLQSRAVVRLLLWKYRRGALHPRLLRIDDLLEERILCLLLRSITLSQACSCALSTLSGVLMHLHAALLDLLEILRIAVMRHGELVGGRGEGRVPQDRLQLRRQRVELRLVEDDLERTPAC